MSEEHQTITPEEAEDVLSTVKGQNMTAEFGERSIMVEVEGTDLTLEFQSMQEEPSLEVGDGRVWTTVSRYFLHREDETMEVETDGPFTLNLEGLGIDELEPEVEHR